ncbi:hypothetical protein AB6A40_011147 [Gnathostoma spinigerum]|uniref:Uncharacterized protein n=1 Tax=Gnathostoma spinigerum TaxID=75299 RepID=A0ABD6EXD3_9BILA
MLLEGVNHLSAFKPSRTRIFQIIDERSTNQVREGTVTHVGHGDKPLRDVNPYIICANTVTSGHIVDVLHIGLRKNLSEGPHLNRTEQVTGTITVAMKSGLDPKERLFRVVTECARSGQVNNSNKLVNCAFSKGLEEKD